MALAYTRITRFEYENIYYRHAKKKKKKSSASEQKIVNREGCRIYIVDNLKYFLNHLIMCKSMIMYKYVIKVFD
jgi:hypothetical protein